MVLEKNIVAAIMRSLKYRGIWCFKVHGSVFQRAGIPDIIAVVKGLAVFIEVKTPTGKVSRIQDHVMNELARHGAVVGVAYSKEDALDIIKVAEERSKNYG